jgi:deazaflavin-dependent oxidoreductase (nitroreductase family)
MDMATRNRKVIEQFRSGGEVEGMHRDRLVLLTTVGARTGRRRTTPMMVHRDGDRLLVVASNNGAPTDPAWFRNLSVNPAVTVELADERYSAVASVLEGAERELIWPMLKEKYPFFAEYDRKVTRDIPVVSLARSAG